MEPIVLQEMIKHDLDEMIGRINEFIHSNNLDQLQLQQDIPVWLKADDVLQSVERLVTAEDQESRSSAALYAVASLGALNAQLSLLTAHFNLPGVTQQVGQAVTNAWNNLQSYLQNLIQSISAHLWQLISSLLTLKEWSVSGNAGVNLFGLAGTIQVELTFG